MRLNKQIIKEKFNIVDYVSRYVRLKKTGRNHVGLCPFHNEKTPSFTVNEQKQIFHCFGCGTGGDLIEFLIKYLKLEYHDVILMLEKESGLKLVERDAEYEKRRAEAEKIIAINRHALKFFIYNLFKTQEGGSALKYIRDRKVSVETIKSFYIGFGGREWDRLARHLEENGFTKSEIERSGLVVYGSSGRRDFFRNRLIFPIINFRDEIIGFGGRAMDDSLPKYINSSEHAAFSKRKNIFGINLAKKFITEKKEVMIVEGYMDCVMMYQEGYRNTVATLGTAMTEEQIKLLKGHADKFYLIFDGDEAGQKAALKGAETFINLGMSAFMTILPEGEDPDSMLASGDRENLNHAIEKSKNTIDFFINYYKIKHSIETTEGLRNFLNSIKKHIHNVDNVMERELILREVSKVVNFAPEELTKIFELKSGRQNQTVSPVSEIKPEDVLISIVIQQPGYMASIDESVKNGLTAEYKEILSCIAGKTAEDELSEEAKKTYGRLCVGCNYDTEEEFIKAFRQAMTLLKKRNVDKKTEAIDVQIREAENRKDFEAVRELLKQKMQHKGAGSANEK